jgi:hypothetical protein
MFITPRDTNAKLSALSYQHAYKYIIKEPIMSASISIKLIPSIWRDDETGLFSARFSEFPVAIVHDDTKENAESRLFQVFEALVFHERNYIVDTVNRQYGTHFKSDLCEISLSKKTIFHDSDRIQEIQMEIPMMA